MTNQPSHGHEITHRSVFSSSVARSTSFASSSISIEIFMVSTSVIRCQGVHDLPADLSECGRQQPRSMHDPGPCCHV